MKKLIVLLLIFFSVGVYAQDSELLQAEEPLIKPSRGKCMVYIARRETVALFINFGIYDGDFFLGKLAINKYFAYECDPGEHAFIAKSENTFYVDANLEEGRIYVIDVKAKMGIVMAQVELVPLDKSGKKYEKAKKKFLSFISKKESELLSEGHDTDDEIEEIKFIDIMSSRLKKFYEMKEKGHKMKTITPNMYLE
jgi:hypothetical protein